MRTSTHKNKKNSLTARVIALDLQLTAAIKRIEWLEDFIRTQIFFEDADFAEMQLESPRTPQQKKMGRRPRISDDDLRRMRDGLFNTITVMRPQFTDAIEKAESADELGWLLIANCPGRQGDLYFLHLISNEGIFWEYIHSDRYAGDLGRIANAMAGVPKCSWRTSLDRCERLPRPKLLKSPFAM